MTAHEGAPTQPPCELAQDCCPRGRTPITPLIETPLDPGCLNEVSFVTYAHAWPESHLNHCPLSLGHECDSAGRKYFDMSAVLG